MESNSFHIILNGEQKLTHLKVSVSGPVGIKPELLGYVLVTLIRKSQYENVYRLDTVHSLIKICFTRLTIAMQLSQAKSTRSSNSTWTPTC